jgi:uncharacterized membrane protein
MPDAKNFFTVAEKELILKAIKDGEKASSGEIRVHIENFCRENVLDRAAFIFDKLEIHKTAQRNGVLFYLAINDRKFAVIGDGGINAVVEEHFWEDVKQLLSEHFKRGEFAVGLSKGIERTGIKLKKHFPYQTEDVNELSDDISFL